MSNPQGGLSAPSAPVPGDGHHFQVVTSYAATCGCGEPEHSQVHAHRFYSPGYDPTLPCACGEPVTSTLHACGRCGAQVGQLHDHGCSVERCQFTGLQWIACDRTESSCDCEDDNGYDADGYAIHTCGQTPHDCGSEVWTGVWPGYAEAIEYGRFVHTAPIAERTIGSFTVPARRGWVSCGPDDPGATPDLTWVVQLCDWDRERRRWVLR